MTNLKSTRAYRASALLRRIQRLEASPALQPPRQSRWLDIEQRPQIPIKRNEHWVIDVLDDSKKPKGRWRRTTDPNDHGLRPDHKIPTRYYHWGFNEDENVIYEDDDEAA